MTYLSPKLRAKNENAPATKTCSKCGVEKPLEDFYVDRRAKDGRVWCCKPCFKAQRKTHNIDYARWAERHREWEERNPNNVAERSRRYRERNRAKYLESKRLYREATKEVRAKAWKVYYAANREALAKKRRAWAIANPEKNRDAKLRAVTRRKARKAGVETKPYTRREIYERDSGECQICRKPLTFEKGSFHIDHIVPISLDGPDIPSNVQLLCPPCNLRKAATLEGQIHLPV